METDQISIHVANRVPDGFLCKNRTEFPRFSERYPKITRLQRWCIEEFPTWGDGPTAVMVQTPTASGKTLAVAAAIFTHIQSQPDNGAQRALFLYPFRALNQDQLGQLVEYGALFGFERCDFEVYQGGSPKRTVREALAENKFLLATPDKIIYLLGGPRTSIAQLTSIIRRYDYLVFDEVHTYSGLMLWGLVYTIRAMSTLSKASIGGVAPLKMPTIFILSATIPPRIDAFIVEQLGKAGYQIVRPPTGWNVSLGGDWEIEIRPTQMVPGETVKHIQGGGVVISNTAWNAWRTRNQAVKEGRIPEDDALLYIGQDKLEEEARKRALTEFARGGKALFTSPAAECGVDFSTSLLITEEATADSVTQRLGRASRRTKGQEPKPARIILYSPTLAAAAEGMDRIPRPEFEGLITQSLPQRPFIPESKHYGFAAYPWYAALTQDPTIPKDSFAIEDDHRELLAKLIQQDAGTDVFFRSFVPFLRYRSGEAVSFRTLCTRNMAITRIGRKTVVQGRPSPERYYYNPREDSRRAYVDLARSKVVWKEQLSLQVKWQEDRLRVMILYGRFLFGFPHTQTSEAESQTSASSLIWLLPEPPRGIPGEFDVYVGAAEKCFPGGFVDEDMWGLDYAVEC